MLICNNLPCPDCANHATRYLQGINFNTIRTKDDLKAMLHAFHNEVNKKKSYEHFNINKLDETYASANTKNMIEHFIYYFQNRSYSLRVGTTSFNRSIVVANLKQWFVDNIHYFDP